MACGEGKLMTNLNILALKKAQLVSDVLDHIHNSTTDAEILADCKKYCLNKHRTNTI